MTSHLQEDEKGFFEATVEDYILTSVDNESKNVEGN